MDRKQFLKASGCCAALAMLHRATGEATAPAPAPANQPAAPAQGAAGPPLTPAEVRVQWAETWAKRFFDVFDANLDPETRERIMRANGRACNEQGLAQGKRQLPPLDVFIGNVRAHLGDEAIRREGDVVYFNYVQNPRGLKVADGYCLCPLVETGPKGLSPTFCFCSVGYVQHMFEVMAGHPVNVELLASLKRGDSGCRFKVSLA